MTVEAPAPPRPVVSTDAPSADRAGAARGFDWRGWLERPLVACLVLFAIYGALSMFNDPRGTLGTDTGSKLATLRVMDQRGSLDPDIGYWAERADPHGDLHPLFYTYRAGGKWVNVTTLPMLYAAYPLYHVLGERGALLLPMFGSVLAALAARALARRLGARTGWVAFWTIGLASPLAIYALDFWEHSFGVAAMLWGVVFMMDVAEERAGWSGALAAGALFGAAATMRTESLVYLVVAAGVTCLALALRKRSLVTAVARGIAMVTGAVAVLAANEVLERMTVGATLRANRAAGTAAEVGTSLATRIREAFTTTVGLNIFEPNFDFVVGAIFVVVVAYGTWKLAHRSELAQPVAFAAFTVALLIVAMRVTSGLGFVPGLLTASPLAAAGAVLGWRRRLRMPVLIALLSLPLVWAFQYSGGAGPQWGGRYELLSGALLAVVATVALEGKRVALTAVLVTAALMTGFGLVWLQVRSHSVAVGIEALVARHDEAVISNEAHLLREGGDFYEPSRRWLTVTSDAELHRALRIVEGAGLDEVALATDGAGPYPNHLGPYLRKGVQKVEFLRPDIHMAIVTYRR